MHKTRVNSNYSFSRHDLINLMAISNMGTYTSKQNKTKTKRDETENLK